MLEGEPDIRPLAFNFLTQGCQPSDVNIQRQIEMRCFLFAASETLGDGGLCGARSHNGKCALSTGAGLSCSRTVFCPGNCLSYAAGSLRPGCSRGYARRLDQMCILGGALRNIPSNNSPLGPTTPNGFQGYAALNG